MERTKQTDRGSTRELAPRHEFQERPSAFADIWAIAVVAENILAHLPIKDLLLAQSVSSDWNELIKGSPRLQELLFMRPMQARDMHTMSSSGMPVRDFNPLLVEHMSPWFSGKKEDRTDPSVMDCPWMQTAKRPAFLRQGASWRKMLLAQPPFTVFERARRVHAMGGDSLTVTFIEQNDGVRMGLVYDNGVEFDGSGYSAVTPNNFYTLLDGKLGCDSSEFSVSNDASDIRTRLFGGMDKFTLCSSTTIGCVMHGYSSLSEMQAAEEAERRAQLHFISEGCEEVSLEKKALPLPEGRRGHGWWTEDGFCRF
ncbi:hypothetical protein LIA77_08610 [Sarocladium implicatum]|nr:hypothetical protein LIA77_08610 [Sarocladium implicatum]